MLGTKELSNIDENSNATGKSLEILIPKRRDVQGKTTITVYLSLSKIINRSFERERGSF